MAIKKRTSPAVLLLLLAVALSVSSHVIVEGNTSANRQPSRRLPTRRVRGLQRDNQKDTGRWVDKLNPTKEGLVEKPNSTPKKVTENKPKILKLARPFPKDKFTDHGVDPQLAARPSRTPKLSGPKGGARLPQSIGKPKLPESNQALQVKVNKGSETNPNKATFGSAPKGVDISEARKNNKGNGKAAVSENGLEHFHAVDVEVYRREIPAMTIQFIVEDPSSSDLPNLADYNELSDVSEEYLDTFFRSVFEDVKSRHNGTVLFVMVSEDDPFTVDFRITLEFLIPGQVPTINYLIDRLQDGLERDTSRAFFISDLSMMSETNPFSKTDTFRVVSRPPVSAAEMDRLGGNKSPVDSIENLGRSNVLTYLLVGMGCVVLVGAGLMWKKKKMNPSGLFEKRGKKDTNTSSTASAIYGADEETMNYLNSIRKRYRDYNGKGNASSPASKGDNIAAVEQTGSFDASEDSMSDSVNSAFEDEKKDSDGLEEDLRTIY